MNQISGGCNGDCGNGANYDAFVTKISAAGDAVVYSSLLGGSGERFRGWHRRGRRWQRLSHGRDYF